MGAFLKVKYYFKLSAPLLFLKSNMFYVEKSQCCRTMKFAIVLMWNIT